jgi:hypothetical protein
MTMDLAIITKRTYTKLRDHPTNPLIYSMI